MDPPRMRVGLPARPNDGPLPRRRGEPITTTSQYARPANRSFKSDPGTSRIAGPAVSIPRPSARLPQTAPQAAPRQMPSYRPDRRPSLEHHSKSWEPASAFPEARQNTPVAQGSGSSAGRSYNSNLTPHRTVLRRKRSSIANEPTASKSNSPRTSSSSSNPRSRASTDPEIAVVPDHRQLESPAEIRVAETMEFQRANGPMIYPELDRYRDHRPPGDFIRTRETEIEVPFRLATHDLPPPTPGSLVFSGSSSQVSAISASPSTKFSESPGPGPYSRDTTPTSMSSQSPGLFVPTVRTNKTQLRYHSPALSRPPVVKRRAGSFNEAEALISDPRGLPAVRESLTSSSSNSTVREAEKTAALERKKNRRKLPAPPPSPPPRKSSQKFRSPSNAGSPSKSSRPSTAPESPPKPITEPLPTGSPGPPHRPSRDGTPDMHSELFDPVPIVHSNLSSASLPGERRGIEAIGPSSLPRSVTSPPTQRPAAARRTSLPREEPPVPSATTTRRAPTTAPEPSRTLRTPSPNTSSSFTPRFPFFGRKKSSVDAKEGEAKEPKKKVLRKGPAAGTGHEGYGRLGHVRRRSGARGASDALSSQESLTEDPFLADRMSPVIIAGGEVIENRNPSYELPRTGSNQSLIPGRPSLESRGTNASTSSSNPSRTAARPMPGYLRSNATSRSRRPSDSSDSEGMNMKSTLAFRRSVQRLRSSPDNPVRLPQPIVTSGSAPSPMTSFDTSVMSDESQFEMHREVSRGRENAHPAPKKLTKRARSPRKWNLFSRSQSRPRKTDEDARVAATVTPVEKKPMAFYTIMDPSEQEGDVSDIQQILRNADVYMSTPSLPGSSVSATSLDKLHPPSSQPPRFTPSPLMSSTSVDIAREDIRIDLRGAQTTPLEPTVARKPSRLQQVGRIPKVVSNRRDLPSPKSFSRPFRASMQLPQPAAMPWTSSPELVQAATKPSPAMSAPGPSGSTTSPEMSQAAPEFLVFSPRKNSDGTLGTSSGSSSTFAYAGATAVVPHPADPPAEDEIWDEYDDLLGEDKPPVSATSSRGMPFALETYEMKLSRKASREKPMESPTIAVDSRKTSTHSKAPTHSTSYSADMTERIRAAFQPHPSPTVPFPDSLEPIAEGKRRNSLDSGTTVEELKHKVSQSTLQLRDSTVSSSSSDDGSPLAQVNLRVGSMTVSKWLSFGHVLFSDVRHELVPVEGSLKRHSILVVDGLGNDDWSFYAAETYPAATFFNLSPRAPLPAELQNSPTGFPLSPPNHHQIQYVSHLEKFPFAPQSFTSLVYRFPVAASEATYRNILTEARRVLKPDGYLELSILDLDLNNMGNMGRKAVRGLKERIQENASDTSLASTADLIVRLLGKLGFSGIKAARVGVPVASSVSRPSSSKDSTASSSKAKKEKPSLAEMMSDKGPVADESITKMVSRVGRWWYTRCYENAAGPVAADKSIWNDKALLSECEQMGTSLKLMVCCARAPDRVTSL